MGDVGRAILYFYQANELIINSIILIYGVFMFYAGITSFAFIDSSLWKWPNQLIYPMSCGKKSNKKIRNIIGIPWEKAIEVSPFPYIASIGALIPKRKTIENLQLPLMKKIWRIKPKALQGAKIQRMMPSNRKMLQREMDQRKENRAAKKKKKQQK